MEDLKGSNNYSEGVSNVIMFGILSELQMDCIEWD